MIIRGLLSCRDSLGDFSDISYSSIRAFSIATRAKHPVQAEVCRVELGHVHRRPITLLCLERVVPLAAPGALLSPAQTCRTGTAPAWRHAMTPRPERDQLFISYSHVDREWVPGSLSLTPAQFAELGAANQAATPVHATGGNRCASTVVHLASEWRQGFRVGSAPPPAPLPGRRRQGLGPWWRVSP